MANNIIDSIQLSGVTYQIQGSGGGITVDPTLDSGSTNPVANSAITTALDAKVNVADNAVSTKAIMYTYDAGDTSDKYLYNNGLRINQFFVSYSRSWNRTNASAWSYVYITNNGSTTSQIYLRVNASNYQITSVVSTGGDFNFALEGGRVNITLPDGYYIFSLGQSPNFQISYGKYTIYGGQSANALQNTDDVIQNIYNEVPKRFLTGGSISSDSNYLYTNLYDNNGSGNSSTIPLGTSIKGEDNRLDVYFNGQTIHQKILNTGNGNYCNVPNPPAWNYTDDLDEVIIHFNSGYTGSNTSYTIQVQTIEPNTNTHNDNLYYDVANHTLDASSANFVTATTVGDDYTYLIKPKQEYSSYKIARIQENNWCNICGIDNQWKEEYIITGVTAPSYSYQAQEIIDDLYSKVGGGKAIEAGRGISITTGETADTVSFNLPISAGTGTNSIIEGSINNIARGYYSHAEGNRTTASGDSSHAEGYITQANGYYSHAEGYRTTASGDSSHAEGRYTKASGQSSHAEGESTTASGYYSHAEGSSTTASGDSSHAEGQNTKASGWFSHAEGNSTSATSFGSHAEGASTQANGQYSHAEGYHTSAMTYFSHAEGWYTIANNQSEHASGQYNISSSASTEFGDSGNTLFSVGNGTADNARHNAFEIRQNGDIYISSGGTDILLQDHLGGGGSVTVDTELDSGSTNPVQNKVIYNKIDEVEQVTAAALNNINDRLSEDEEVTAASLNALNDNFGGLKLVKLSQAAYDSLATKDASTLYVIVD